MQQTSMDGSHIRCPWTWGCALYCRSATDLRSLVCSRM